MTILIWDEARLKMFAGIEKVATVVASTIWPKGRNVIFAKNKFKPQITNDGVTVAKNIQVEDPIENIGASLIKDVADQTNENVGDGTTTATILAYAMIKEGIREIRSGINAVELKNGMKLAWVEICKMLEANSKKITTNEEIKQVATISSQDEEVGSIIAEAMDKVGENGVVTVSEWQKVGIELELSQGMKFERGYFSPYMVTDVEKMEAKYTDVKVLVTDKKIQNLKPLLPLLEQLIQSGINSLVIICDNMENEAIAQAIQNKLKGIFNILAIRASGIGERRKETAKDLALLTGATFLEDDLNIDLSKVTPEMLGTIQEITTTSDSTTIICEKDDKVIEQRVKEIRKSILKEEDKFQVEKKEERIARLTAWVAIIKVGATTEIEMKEKKLRIEDALNATKAAISEGIVAGGGVALTDCFNSNEILSKSPDGDLNIWYWIVIRSLIYPIKYIVENCGKNGDIVISKITDNYLDDKPTWFWYDAKNDTYGDMIKMGIIDPKKVTRIAVENAISIASTFLTTESVSYIEEKEEVKVF